MMGLRRRKVVEWFRVQAKFKVMYNDNVGFFQLRDMVNNISVGAFRDHDDAVEFAFDFVHDTLSKPVDASAILEGHRYNG